MNKVKSLLQKLRQESLLDLWSESIQSEGLTFKKGVELFFGYFVLCPLIIYLTVKAVLKHLL
jgi:hypothetical protein